MRNYTHPFYLFLLLHSVFLAAQIGATGDSSRFLLATDSLQLSYDASMGQLIFKHRLAPKQTLYSLAKFYGLRLEDVYHLNPGLRVAYAPGDAVTITLPRVAIKHYVPYDSIDHYAPVFWTFAKGETLYGLVHRSLKLPSDSLLYFNNPGLSATNVRIGQQLFIGWLPLAGISAEMQGEIEDPYMRMNKGLRDVWLTQSEGKRLQTTSGKAAWISDGDRSKFMALHRTAPPNSLIEVMDKRTGKVLYCRVMGPIPGQLYDSNVAVVLSPLLVKAFGVRDRFFYVQVKHY